MTAGDFDGDGKSDLAFGGGPGGGPRVLVLSGSLLSGGRVEEARASSLANFFASNSAARGGVRLAAKDANGDGVADLIVGSGEGEVARVSVFTSSALKSSHASPASDDISEFANGQSIPLGVFVG